jgi:endonuclease G, mitochondrial
MNYPGRLIRTGKQDAARSREGNLTPAMTHRLIPVYAFSFLLLLLACTAAAQSPQPHEPCGQEGQMLRYPEFSLRYAEEYEQPYWVAYMLDAEELDFKAIRKDYFKADPAVEEGSASLADYRNSGFDRGHLSRAEYNKRSLAIYKQCFLMSNMSPQVGEGFNRTGGLWYRSEEYEMELCRKYKRLYSISGPVFCPGDTAIGANRVTVPCGYYKVIVYRDEAGQWTGLGLFMENRFDKQTPPEKCIVPIRRIEELTGLDFNCTLLDDETEQRIEN